MIKLSFKKWWMYLRSPLRRWLRECEKHLNSKDVKKRCEFKNPNLPFYRALYGKDFPNNVINNLEVAEKIRKNQKEIVDYFIPAN